MRFSISDMCQTALLAAFIAVSGSFKIPSLIPGSEFQLSAPVAVAACGIFGIKKYLTAGIAASAICLILGTQNVFNVLIALSFRAVIAIMFAFMGSSKAFYIIAGPVASALSRLVLALFVDKAVYALIAGAGHDFYRLCLAAYCRYFNPPACFKTRAYAKANLKAAIEYYYLPRLPYNVKILDRIF